MFDLLPGIAKLLTCWRSFSSLHSRYCLRIPTPYQPEQQDDETEEREKDDGNNYVPLHILLLGFCASIRLVKFLNSQESRGKGIRYTDLSAHRSTKEPN